MFFDLAQCAVPWLGFVETLAPPPLFDGVSLVQHADLDPNRNFSNEEKLILFHHCKGLRQLEKDGRSCGRTIDFVDAVVDHIVPYSLGGRTILGNGRIAYSRCNVSRGNRDSFDPTKDCIMETAKQELPPELV
jgi:HNH endonuclease